MKQIFSLFDEAPDRIKTSVDEAIANLREQRQMAVEFERNMQVLMAAGLDALVIELINAGPAAVDLAAGFAEDMSSAFTANLILDPSAGLSDIADPNQLGLARDAGVLFGKAMSEGLVSGFNPRLPSAPTFPRLPSPAKRALGGPVAPNTPYTVGERGPEVFVPSGAGSITPNDEIGGSTVNVYIDRVETDDLAGDLAEGLIRASVTEQVDLIGAW